MQRAVPVFAVLFGAVLALLLVLTRIDVRTDMATFLPAGRSEAARMVLDEARSGAATGIVLIGIEGAPTPMKPEELARVARAMAAALPGTGLFQFVAGGPGDGADQTFLFEHRYLLSPRVTASSFSEAGLRAGVEGVLRQMRSSAAPVAVQYGLADPVGAFLALVQGWNASGVRVIDGVWFAADGSRALLLARTKAGGMDVPAQEAALGAIEAAFQDAGPGGARLLVAGPGVFARDAARVIRGDVERIAVVSTLLVVGLLWWRFRSPLVLAAVAAPVVLSVAVAAVVVQAVFGMVHGVALGFGATMLGVSVDYPVLMIGHRKRGEPAGDTRRRIGRAFVLAVICALLGLLAMVASGFPGLEQLGVFAAAGLAACAVLTWVLLPRVIVAANLAPVAAGDLGWLERVEGWRRFRLWGLAPVLVAAGFLAWHGVRWEGDLQALSPVPRAALALDREMRAQLGAGETGQMVLVRGATAEAVLQAEESLLPVLERLRQDGAIAGYEAAASVLPSLARQRARIAVLPDAETLARRMDVAAAGLGFRAGAFAPFLAGVAAAREAAPLRPEDLAGTLVAARLAPLLVQRGAGWVGPVVLQAVRDADGVGAAVQGAGLFVDMRRELGGVLAEYTGRGWLWLGVSLVLVLGVLGVGLGDAGRVLRVLGALGAALVVTVALLTAGRVRLSLIHLVALQLVMGVGLDYALFFARRQLDAEERARTLRTLVTCNGMTLLTFGLLASCRTPLLRDIGVTVAVGAVSAMGFAFLFAGKAREEQE